MFVGQRRGRRAASLFAVSAALLGLIGSLALTSPAVADDEDDPLAQVIVDLSKTVTPTVAEPGSAITYSIAVNCASTRADCVDLAINDRIPDPFVLGSVALSNTGPDAGLAQVSYDEDDSNAFTVSFVDDLGEGRHGLQAGVLYNFAVTATLPADVSADYDADIITNTAYATLANVNSDRDASADVTLTVPLHLSAGATKSYSESGVPSIPGHEVTLTLGGSNTSNTAVDSLTIEDSTPGVFDYLAVTGATVSQWPNGSDQVAADWFDGENWQLGTPSSELVLPEDPSLIQGLRFTFYAADTGIVRTATGRVAVDLALRDNVLEIEGQAEVHNTAAVHVTDDGTSSPDATAPATLTITKAEIAPVATKHFSTMSVVGGEDVTVTLGASNGGQFTLSELAISEPSADGLTLADQGLGFGGFVADDIEWPVGATQANIAYLYEGETDFATAIETNVRDTLPAPEEGRDVIGFRVRFTGTMLQGQYAVVPYRATTSAVEADVTTANTITVDATTTTGLTASTSATDSLTSRTARINTSQRKIATPTLVYSVPGTSSVVSLPGQLDPRPTSAGDTGGSTVGAKSLTITDADPEFWDYFDISQVLSTTVPGGVTLAVEYWDGEQWLQFDSHSGAVGPVAYSRPLSSGERAVVQGIRFIFTPTDESGTLAPGFAVQPNLRVVLRSHLRSDPGALAADPSAPEIISIDNTATSTAFSPSTTPSTVQGSATAALSLKPVPSGPGGGVDLIDKNWLRETVDARTHDEASVQVHWGTGNLEFDSVTISDARGDSQNVASTVYEAFDLVAIPEITSDMDPLLTYDAVTGVQLLIGGEWVDTASNPCASNACDGAFPGYTLTADESAAAEGVRLVFEESPTRGDRIGDDPMAPPVGSGVAGSFDRDRTIELTFAIRDARRSDPSVPVLGSSRSALYNAGAADYGVVNNTATFTGTAPDSSTRSGSATDDILVLDQPLTVTAAKSWTSGPFGTPPEGTPEKLYPTGRMTLTATNTSLARVDSLSLAEPSPTIPQNPFEYFNVTDIVSITVPSGPDATVTLLPSGDEFSVTQAEALDRDDLKDVTGILVELNGTVESQASITLIVDTQLRATNRTDGLPVEAGEVNNEITATIVDPGGSQVPAEGSDVNVVSALASANAQIQVFEYGVIATKTLIADTAANGSIPATQWASTTAATVRLSGQPTGNVRTTTMVIEDTDASFWNAYDFSGFPSLSFATPINRVQVDVLVGTEYIVGPDNSITSSCPDTDCWVIGTPSATPTLPAGVSASDVRGIRFTFTRSDYAAWERPFNPKQTIDFTVQRREYLVEPADELVPSTLFTFTEPAPGESVIGTWLNDASVEVNSALSATDTTPLWSRSASDSSSITYAHLPAKVSISKSQYGPQSLGVDLPFDITVKNTGGVHTSPLTGVTVVDTLPVDGNGPMLVVPTDPETGEIYTADDAFTYSLLNTSGTAVTAPDVTAVYDDPDHPTTITFTLNQTLPIGWSLVIHSPLQFRPLLGAAVEAQNQATVTADQPFDECRGTVDTQWTDPTTFVMECDASTIVWPLPSSPMTIVKSVRGIEAGPLDSAGVKLIDPLTDAPYDDLGVIRTGTGNQDCSVPTTLVPGRSDLFYKYPCVPITRPGAEEEWGARFYNSGNISIKQLVAIDVLPAPNDRGVIIDEARSSKWAAKLSSYPEVTGVPSGTTYTVYYTDVVGEAAPNCNGADIQLTMGMTTISDPPILNTPQYRNCLDSSGAALASPRDWKVLDPGADAATLASVVALKFDVQIPSGLAPGASAGVLYRTITANQQAIKETSASNLYRDSIAYNSIAGAAVGINRDREGNPLDLAYRFVTEPRKVGVALATGQLHLSKQVTGAAASYATTNFDLTLSCVSNEETVALTLADGSARNPFVVTKGTSIDVYGVPLYSTCSVGEGRSYGATTVTTSDPVQALAQPNSGASVVFDPHPAFEERPALETATVTNDYAAASLTLTKTVETNGAVDQDGTAITYKPALASVSCTFDNGTGAANVLNQTNVQLVPGTPVVYSGLPAGALCIVTETNQRGATTTSVVTTSAGAVSGGASPAQFTLTEGANSVGFANDFGVGSLKVTKALAGLAKDEAWAAGPFTMTVVCTNSNATSSTVFSKTITLSRASTEYVIDNLATGSSCVTTETDRNGATSASGAQTVTINRAQQTATITNTFDYARLTVKKLVSTTAVDGSGAAVRPGPFSFSVVCTFTYGSPAAAVTVLNTTFSLSHNETKVLTGLPAGASCVVTEDTPPGSPTTKIDTATSSTSASVTALTATINSLTKDTSPTVGTNTATITNTYAVGTLRITKSLKGGASTQFGTGPFTFLVSCTYPGVTAPYSKTVTQNTAGTTNVTNIMAGSTCSISESNFASTGADAEVILNNSNVAFDGTGITVVGGATRTTTFQNWYLTGAVTVTKSVTGPGAAYGTGPFTVHLECTRGGSPITITGGADRSLVGGGSATYTKLPSGASCTLTETGKGGAGATVITNGTATDLAGAYTFTVAVNSSSLTDDQAQPALTVTNTFELASLVVSKAVQSDAVHEDGSAVTYGSYPMQVSCTFESRAVRATGFTADVMTFDLADGGSRTLSGLPAGAVCVVTETNVHGAARTSISTVSGGGTAVSATGTSASVTLVPAASNSATVHNEYDSGAIVLGKTVTGDAREQYGTATFPVTVECVLVDGASSQTVWTGTYEFVDGSEPVTLSPIAAGAECEITEQDAGGATSTTVTAGTTTTPGTTASATVPAGQSLPVTVTNTFDYASLAVSKTVSSDAVDQNGDPVYPGGSFAVEVVCEFLGETVIASGYDSSPMQFSLGHGEVETLQGLAAGASCDVTETDTVEANSTTIKTTTGAGSATVDATTATIGYLTSGANSAAITNRYGVTSFTVEKVLEGGATQFGVGPFDIHVVCTAPGGVVAYDETVSLPNEGDWFTTIEDIPNGSTCTTDESNFDETGADAQRTLDADGDAVPTSGTVVTADEPGYVAIHNWYLTGALDVTKRVTGDGAAFGVGPFEVTLECTRGSWSDTATREFVDGETVTFDGLPSGAECDLTESNAYGATATSFELGDASVDSVSFTVDVDASDLTDDQAQPAVRVTNRYDVASLTVTKSVNTDAVNESGDAIEYGPFPVAVTCDFEGSEVWAPGFDAENPMATTLDNGESWTLEGLPAGAECEIVETDAMDADETSIDTSIGGESDFVEGTSASVVLVAGDDNAATITNTYAASSVTLSKIVTGDGAEAWGTEAFDVSLECTLTDASGTRVVYSDTVTFHQGDEPITIENIATGAVCDVTEAKTGAATATSITIDDEEPVLGTSAEFSLDGKSADVAVTNRFDVTSVDVTKERTGDGAEAWGDGPFAVTLTCERDVDGETQAVALESMVRSLEAPDYIASFDGLPVGAHCAIAETEFGGANGSNVSPQVFDLASDATDVMVSNVFNEGELTVVKHVQGDGVGVELWGSGPFEVSLECTRVVNGETVSVEIPDGATRPLDVDHEYVATYQHLPQGARCVVSETEDGDATSTVIEPGAVIIPDSAAVTVDVTNTFTIGSLQIVKTASQPVVEGGESFDYTFEVSNTGTVPAAGITVVDDIPDLLRVTDVTSDGWTDCSVADTDTFGFGGVLTCVYDETLAAGASADAFTITVEVAQDVAVDSIPNVASVTSTTRGVTGDDDDETVLVKWLEVTAASECVLDAPWFDYSIDARNLDTTGRTLTVTWSDKAGNVIHTDEVALSGGPISGKLLWPGAAVNADGVGIAWPGWRPALPGETPEFENLVLDPALAEYPLREDTVVTFSINPSATVEVAYPQQTEACAVERTPGIWVTKVASTTVVPAGGEFDYTIAVGNNDLGAVQDLSMVDEVPSSLKVLSVTPAEASDDAVPAWESCEITDRLPNGFGGTVTCLLDRPIGYQEQAPDVVLHVQLDPSVAQGSVMNVARVTGTATQGSVVLEAQDSATVLTPGMLALTGMVLGGYVLPLALGLLTLGGILIAVRVAPRSGRRRA